MRTELCLAAVATLWATVVAGLSGATAAEPTSSGTTVGSLSTSGCPTSPSSVARPWLDEASTPACRASYLLAALSTLDDKLSFDPDLARARSSALATYFPAVDWTGTPVATRVEDGVNLATVAPVDGLPEFNQWSVRYTGTLIPEHSGSYGFSFSGAGSGTFTVDCRTLGAFNRTDMSTVQTGTIDLEADRPVPFQADYTPRSTAANLGTTPVNESAVVGVHAVVGWQQPTDAVTVDRSAATIPGRG